jgi:arylformamidase
MPLSIPARLDPDAHEAQYNPRVAVPDANAFLEAGAAASATARAAFAHRELRYGSGPLATLDVFPAARSDAPVHVFIHGGYWRALDKRGFSSVAAGLVPLGITTVLMNYDLCPSVSLPALVAQFRAGVRWICAHAAELGGDPENITFSGHSAGAHLVATALAADAQQRDPLPLGQIRGAMLISGIYDLAPVLGITVNETIRLQPDQVDAMSPTRHPPVASIPLDILVGADEPPRWIDQSTRYAEVARSHGAPCTLAIVPSHHHFSITTLLASPEAELSQRVARLAGVAIGGMGAARGLE